MKKVFGYYSDYINASNAVLIFNINLMLNFLRFYIIILSGFSLYFIYFIRLLSLYCEFHNTVGVETLPTTIRMRQLALNLCLKGLFLELDLSFNDMHG
jgi:hypothetical protein